MPEAPAHSAIRAGCRPSTIDLFADQDLIEVCTANQVAPARFPDGLAGLADRVEPTHWIYTGALENHPDLVDQISRRHRLLGNSGRVLRAVRDPIAVVESLRTARLNAPDVQIDCEGLPRDGSWLAKPRASAGGRGIRPFEAKGRTRLGSHYFQRRVEGLSLSALFMGRNGRSNCLGITRQFVGKPGNRFAYRGTLAPWPVSAEVSEQVERIGSTLATSFDLVGLFGVDLMVEGDRVWLIEVNPRYTAAVEALEWATGRSLLRDQLGALGFVPDQAPVPIQALGFVGKVILYARRALDWPTGWNRPVDLGSMPEIADIPIVGTKFEPGEPVLTVLASGDDPVSCRRNLAHRVREWRRRLDSLRPVC